MKHIRDKNETFKTHMMKFHKKESDKITEVTFPNNNSSQ